ncbi:MAG: YicC family protein [Oscillospiraceae bacterium]|jgi:uncharacterized protein (TIGR00255 family)|nr:YicC family protein [Oscillospiraceae bacterium]
MIKSMTGYGSAKGSSGSTQITIEVKSVNNRYLDCTIKIPRVFISLEEPLKTTVHKHISRGKVDIFVSLDTSGTDDIEIKVNHPLAKSYIEALKEIACRNEINSDIHVTDLTRYPDILQATKREINSEEFFNDLNLVLADAMSDFNIMRVQEGAKLCKDILERLDCLEKLTAMAEEISPRTVAEYRTKLETRMNEVLQSTGIEEAKILAEAAIFADRVAISEELVRLQSHISQLREMCICAEPVGRKIDFIVQELNREANTIGSKGNDPEMSKVVVEMKSEIEKIREQAQNIE